MRCHKCGKFMSRESKKVTDMTGSPTGYVHYFHLKCYNKVLTKIVKDYNANYRNTLPPLA